MSDPFDPKALELLERQLADRVTERVRPALFKLYAVTGGAVIAVLGYLGFNLLDEIKSRAHDIVDAALKEVQAEVQKADVDIKVQLGRADELSDRLDRFVDTGSQALEAFRPKAAQLEMLTKELDELTQKRSDLETRLGQAQEILLRVEALPTTVAQLGEQLQTLSVALEQRARDVASGPGGVALRDSYADQIAKVSSEVGPVITAAKSLGQEVQTVRERPTVYFQFAGGERRQAEELAAALRQAGYPVPGEDREAGAAGKREVRYFYDKDKVAAEKLAEDTRESLVSLGYTNRPIAAVSLVSYGGTKPKRGVVELWLELPAR
jgi:flagellar biosynthesis chaperone FliJ